MNKHYTLGLYPLVGNGYRKFCWPWWKEYLDPRTYYKTVKYFCQRGYRGYADCDAWDAHNYLESVMLGVITELKENKQGCPSSFILSDDEPFEIGFNRWQAVLQEILDGLEASHELGAETTVPDGVYSDYLWEMEPCPDHPGFSQVKPLPDGASRFNAELYKEWQTPLIKKRKRAVYLINKYWENFWD